VDGQTVLHLVAKRGLYENGIEDTIMSAHEFLERIANLLTVRDNQGRTPREVAVDELRGLDSNAAHVFGRWWLKAYWSKVLLLRDGRLALHVILRNTMFPGGRRPLRLDTKVGRLGMKELKDMLLSGIVEDPSLLRVQDSRGMLPLHVAAERGAPVHLLQLLTFPGALRVADNRGGLVIHAACRTPPVVRLSRPFGIWLRWVESRLSGNETTMAVCHFTCC